MIKVYIGQVVNQGDGNFAVTGSDEHGNTTIVHCGRDAIENGTVYALLELAIGKVVRTRAALGRADAGDREEG